MAEELEKIYQAGRAAFEKGKYDEAEGYFLQLLEKDIKYADVYNKLGIIYNQRGDIDRAIEHFKTALLINPAYTEASLNLTITYNEKGSYDEANKVFTDAAKMAHSKTLDPFIRGKIANEHMKLGDQYYDLGLFDDALEEYRKGLNLRPTFVDIITKIGITLREMGNFDEAIRVFTRAKEINPRFLPAIINLGITYYMKGFMNLAAEEWENAVKIDPTSRQAKVYLHLCKREVIG